MAPEDNDFAVVVDREDGDAVVHVRGEVDIYTAPQLRDSVLDVLAEGVQRLVLEVAGVRFMDSTGLGVLAMAHKKLSAVGGRVVVRSPSPTIRKLLELTKMNTVVEVENGAGDQEASESAGTP